MGSRPRHKQENLAKKLLRIRNALELTQFQLVKLMGVHDSLPYHRISEYESGRREPSLWVLLAYARIAGVHLEDIVDDNIDLPEKLPGRIRYRKRTNRPPGL
jgi:transcriptional regulator with XRE-family HTH domain